MFEREIGEIEIYSFRHHHGGIDHAAGAFRHTQRAMPVRAVACSFKKLSDGLCPADL